MYTWEIVMIGAAALICIAAAVVLLRSVYSLRQMERLLESYEHGGVHEMNTLRETRESKLESRLERLLLRAEHDREQAQEERSDVTALLSNLSHQLKTPLANVVMYAELLEDETLADAEKREFAAQVCTQARKMQWLMEDMLQASHLEQGSVKFSAEYCGIRETVNRAVDGVRAQAEARDIRIVTEPFEDRRLFHNRKWTVEALGNLLDNAVKYSPDHSTVTVRLCQLAIYSVIEIEDHGAGITPSEYNDIFRRFYRGKDMEQQEGNGLGLYIAQLILNREKGYITVRPTPGGGSTFCVSLLNESSYK